MNRKGITLNAISKNIRIPFDTQLDVFIDGTFNTRMCYKDVLTRYGNYFVESVNGNLAISLYLVFLVTSNVSRETFREWVSRVDIKDTHILDTFINGSYAGKFTVRQLLKLAGYAYIAYDSEGYPDISLDYVNFDVGDGDND